MAYAVRRIKHNLSATTTNYPHGFEFFRLIEAALVHRPESREVRPDPSISRLDCEGG
jgi:hypothetical protein